MTKRFAKAYVEITNVCNLSCSFCKGTDRKSEFMSVERFTHCAKKLKPYTDFIYLHVLGEPLLHPELCEILSVCKTERFKVIITTNGTLFQKQKHVLLNSDVLFKVNVSLHSFEANNGGNFEEYLDGCFDFCKSASEKGIVCVMRLWNGDSGKKYGQNTLNDEILQRAKQYFCDGDWVQNPRGTRILPKLFVENAERFQWRCEKTQGKVRCYGLRDQVGVLCDGTVVPCCIDCDGNINLGNIFTDNLDEILNGELVAKISDGFKNGHAVMDFCRGCGFVRTRLG